MTYENKLISYADLLKARMERGLISEGKYEHYFIKLSEWSVVNRRRV